jgi:transglutaminase-like putative cysteine protease
MHDALAPTPTVDSDHPAVISFAEATASGARGIRERAVKLYYAVRDGVRYDPYSLQLTVPGLRASSTLQAGRGWCVPKAILLAACCTATRRFSSTVNG